MRRRKTIITCEHGGNYVPKEYRYLFQGAEAELQSHKGWDIGALEVAKYLSRHLSASMAYQRVSRLLVETNRSLHSDELFSEYSWKLDKPIRKYLLNKFYHPYRNDIEKNMTQLIEAGEDVLHLSLHTFTPMLNGIERQIDIGLLCDESRRAELEFCKGWKEKLQEALPNKIIMINVPYNGADDGFTTYLRTRFEAARYLGIELEINQKYVGTAEMSTIRAVLSDSLMTLDKLALT